jgi:hypothetical protein
MRTLLVIALAALAGCKSSTDAPLPKQPDAPTSQNNILKLEDGMDTRSHKVAASVAIVKENAGKPEVVKAESDVALSFLPKPSEAELALARQRAAKADQTDYAEAAKFGSKVLAQITEARTKMEADQKEAKRVSDLKDARIKELQAEVERVKKDSMSQTWTLVGAGLAVIGALTTAFMGPKIGVPLLLCGAFCGSVPFIIDSPYFEYIAGGTLLAVAGLGLWWLADKVRDSVHSNDNDQTPPKE